LSILTTGTLIDKSNDDALWGRQFSSLWKFSDYNSKLSIGKTIKTRFTAKTRRAQSYYSWKQTAKYFK